jgi:hypothetical protein
MDGHVVLVVTRVLPIGKRTEHGLVDDTCDPGLLERLSQRRGAAGLPTFDVPLRNAPSTVPAAAYKKDFKSTVFVSTVAESTSLRDIAPRDGFRKFRMGVFVEHCPPPVSKPVQASWATFESPVCFITS